MSIWPSFVYTTQTHREFVVYRPLMPSHLPYLHLVKYTHSYKKGICTFHYYLHIVDQTMDHTERLGYGHP